MAIHHNGGLVFSLVFICQFLDFNIAKAGIQGVGPVVRWTTASSANMRKKRREAEVVMVVSRIRESHLKATLKS